MLTAEQICCLILKADDCAGELAYKIAIKTNRGYCVDDLHEKLAYIYSLKDTLEEAYKKLGKVVKNNIIYFSGEKVLLSKNNPLFLESVIDECLETELQENCCTDLCEIESKLSSVCINC